MPLYFKTLRSSSSGNCVLLWSERTALLFDCGLKTQCECRDLLAEHTPGRLDAAIVSHAHGDHIGYAALRALGGMQVPVYAHETVTPYLRRRHGVDEWPAAPELISYGTAAMSFGDIEVTPVEVPHDPDTPTFGFVVRHEDTKAVLCTDFCNFAGVLDQFVDADFVYVESNHDPHLLRLHPNYASRWHMSNAKTAWLLYHATSRSRRPAHTVVLGHLSRQRNRPELARSAVREAFARERTEVPFRLMTAPLYEPSPAISVTRTADAAAWCFPRDLFEAGAAAAV